jgi:GNAT superfamily N-acetyltransferase
MKRKPGPARGKGSRDAERSSRKGLGAHLVHALTDQQLSGLLDAVFGLLDAEGRACLVSRVDRETAEVLSWLGDGRPIGAKPVATPAKYVQEWELVWDRWHQVTVELGIEEGRYVYQEHDWEPPRFDGESFAESLDEVARDLLPLIERIIELGIEDKNLFRDELLQIKEDADSYPDWMGESECTLGPSTTTCFLKWEWCTRSTKESGSEEFLERIRMTDDELEGVDLDDGALVEFFDSLSASSQREALAAIRKVQTSALWQERFSSPRSTWHRVLSTLLARFDTDSYLEDCMDHLDQEWSYGLPVIEHLMKKNDLLRADEILARTFASLLRFEPEARREWIPEETLLVEKLAYYSPSPDARVVKLLAYAIAIARRRGKGQRAAILALQRVIYKDPCRWNEIAGAFGKLLGSPRAGSARMLLSRWEKSMAEQSIRYFAADENVLGDTWVHWLIEAGIDKAKGPESFQERMKRWFAFLERDSTRCSKSRSQIIALAGDLSSVTSLKQSHPQFARLTRGEERYGVTRCARARRQWLKRMGAEAIVPGLIACVKSNASYLVPDPAHAYGSRYEEHAQWLRAVKEIDPVACQTIIERWKVEHKRRRNLWDALKRGGLT